MQTRRNLLATLAVTPALPALIAPRHARAQVASVAAIDIALEPDAMMLQKARAANTRLLAAYPNGFSLDETHHPHVTILQQFVHIADLDNVYSAVNSVLAKEKTNLWKLHAFKYYFIPSPPIGLAGIVVRPTPDLHRLQDNIVKVVTPFTVKIATAAAFMSTEGGRDIQSFLLEYVADFTKIAAGPKFNPHVTIGVGTEVYLKAMLAEPFEEFTFSSIGASVYQLGSFGTARKKLAILNTTG